MMAFVNWSKLQAEVTRELLGSGMLPMDASPQRMEQIIRATVETYRRLEGNGENFTGSGGGSSGRRLPGRRVLLDRH